MANIEDGTDFIGVLEANYSSSNNFSRYSFERTHQVRRRDEFEKSPSPFQNLKSEECRSTYCFEDSRSAPVVMYQDHMQACLRPGCVPTAVTIQVPLYVKQSTSQLRDVLTADTEVDLWLQDICNQAFTLQDFSQPVISAPVVSALTVQGDEEDVWPRKTWHPADKALMLFLQNQNGVDRRNAICEELEKTKNLVKINGAKFTLWHLRADLLNNFKITKPQALKG